MLIRRVPFRRSVPLQRGRAPEAPVGGSQKSDPSRGEVQKGAGIPGLDPNPRLCYMISGERRIDGHRGCHRVVAEVPQFLRNTALHQPSPGESGSLSSIGRGARFERQYRLNLPELARSLNDRFHRQATPEPRPQKPKATDLGRPS